MIEIIWEAIVKEEARGSFELAFGPGGAWSKFFAKSPGFRGTTLLRDIKDPRRYLTIELWDSEDQREQTLAERKSEFAELDNPFGGWTESRSEVGVFKSLAEAIVRPAGRSTRRKTEEARRASRRGHR
jgi:heme-degrading monooxygenase HmoA